MELRERLRHALPSGPAEPLARGTTRPASRSADFASAMAALPGLQAIGTSRGTIYLTDQRWPLTHSHGRPCLGDALSLPALALSRLAPGLAAAELASAAFVDVETTGLAGGTGTYVFLVGIGTFEEDSFRVRQFFLADLSGEITMLAAVADVLATCPALVSFNGRRFDMPLLETRLTLNRLASLPAVRHLDLLYPARRLYQRRLPSCRLGVLEQSLLGLTREDDVPSWLVPSLYIDYLRTGSAGPLRGVFHHNALDILSLVSLLAHLGHLAGGIGTARAEDYLALGRWDESEGRLAEAASVYATALEVSEEGEARSTARWRLAHVYRRLHRLEDAAHLWRREVESGGPVQARLGALVELAKLEEHRRRDFAAAEALTRRALSLREVAALRGAARMPPQLRQEALEHRLWRLSRRIAANREEARIASRPARRAVAAVL